MAKKKPATALEAELEALPDMTKGRAHTWTPEQDRLILKFVPTKGTPAVAAILGLKYETVRRRWYALKAEK